MKKLLKKTFNKAIDTEGHQNYSDEDLFNASLIFSHVLLDVMYKTYFEDINLTLKEKKLFAKNAGTDIRNLIELYTDKDMRKIAKKLINK